MVREYRLVVSAIIEWEDAGVQWEQQTSVMEDYRADVIFSIIAECSRLARHWKNGQQLESCMSVPQWMIYSDRALHKPIPPLHSTPPYNCAEPHGHQILGKYALLERTSFIGFYILTHMQYTHWQYLPIYLPVFLLLSLSISLSHTQSHKQIWKQNQPL
jgi:hypothetical protein